MESGLNWVKVFVPSAFNKVYERLGNTTHKVLCCPALFKPPFPNSFEERVCLTPDGLSALFPVNKSRLVFMVYFKRLGCSVTERHMKGQANQVGSHKLNFVFFCAFLFCKV